MFQTTFDAENLLWTGPDRFITHNPDKTIGQAILDALDDDGEKVVQV